jgi:hypothetical protein
LKLLKLHFFTCAADDTGKLLETFNKFYAMPYGHVESEVYSLLESLKYVAVTNNSLNIRLDKLIEINGFRKKYISYSRLVTNSINSLEKENNYIIDYSSIQLVSLSHNWYSWKAMFEMAREDGSYSESIPVDLIKSEKKIFELI